MTAQPFARALVASLLLLGARATCAAAGDPLARVEDYLGSLKTLSAEFVQVVRNRDGQIVDRATGTLSLSRPDRFRWDYREPYVQTIVADGRKLCARQRPRAGDRAHARGWPGSTPAMLPAVPARSATVSLQERRDRRRWTWCRLQPKASSSGFRAREPCF
jgi:outer membrane lipoprotein carrier protein